MATPGISIVSPVYNAQGIIEALVARLREEVSKIVQEFEIILVEDGSSDASWAKIEEACRQDSKVKGIKLSRNFGQHYAVTAGLAHASGSCTVILDCDLQDNPADIETLHRAFQSGYDVVFTKRKQRRHGVLKSCSSVIYNVVFRFLSDKQFDVNAGSMILVSKKAKDAFLQIQDKDRLYLQLFKWVGFRSTQIEVEHNERCSGVSSYTFLRLMSLGVQGLTSHSDKLLRLSIYLGFSLASFAFFAISYIVVRFFTHGFKEGWASVFVLILFSTGLILISIGITGVYIGKIFDQAKGRPLYIIEQTCNTE